MHKAMLRFVLYVHGVGVVCTWCVCVCVDVHEGKLLAHEVMLCGMFVHLVCAYVMCCARLVSVYVY